MSTKYPIFLECTEYTLDEYWIDILKNCSLGKFPRGMTIVDDGKTMKITVAKKKYEMIDVLHDDPLEMFRVCMDIFKNKLKMTSSRDHRIKVKEFDETKGKSDREKIKSWDEIKKYKVEKDMCIHNFVLRMQKKYSMSDDETIHLNRLIKIGILFKTINSSHILIKNGYIEDITNLNYINGKFTIDNSINVKIKTSNNKNANDNPLKKEIVKYLERI